MKSTEVTAGLAESNGSQVGLQADCLSPGSAVGLTLCNEYGRTLPFYLHQELVGAPRKGYFVVTCLLLGMA